MRLEANTVLAATAALCTACAGGEAAELRPATPAEQPAALPRAAFATVEDVRVVAQFGVWPGDPAVETQVTPIRLLIENHSAKPLRVRYQDFTLEGPRQDYAALDPHLADADEGQAAAHPYESRFEHQDFFLSPDRASSYPSMSVYPNAWAPDHPEPAPTRWTFKELPTPLMLSWALPEGVIETGGRVDGFLYFEKVPARDEPTPMSLTAQLHTPEGAAIGRARIAVQAGEADTGLARH